MPEVSVIIPFYSNVEWLEEAVESVFNQTYNNYEIIVINDGSSEDIRSFLFKYRDKIKYIEKENGGPSTARNLGIKYAQGEYIAFLDSDDRWLSNKLEVQISQMKKYNIIWSYCGYKTFGMGKKKSYFMTNSKREIIQRYSSPYIATPCVVIQRKFLLNNRDMRFNSSLRYGQDSYLWLMINSNNSILAIPDILVEVRIRGNNASKCAFIQLQARSDIWNLRKSKKEELIDKYNISILYRFASELCVMFNKIIKLFNKVLPFEILELFSKFLFFFPWILYKLDRKVKKFD